jgi:uncharacterized protein YjbI with pentapeptide repeats
MQYPQDPPPGTAVPLLKDLPLKSTTEPPAPPPKENPQGTLAQSDAPRTQRKETVSNDRKDASTSVRTSVHPRRRRLARYVKNIALILGGIIAYYQYLDQTIQSTISREEELLSATATQLDSGSEAVRASAVRTIYDLAFKRTPVEPPPSPIAPLLNLTKWVLYKPEFRNFQRCRGLFQEFAAAPRKQVLGDRDMVSSEIIRVSIEWIGRQNQLFGIDRKNPDAWLLYRAQLSKAYAPSSQLQDVQFSDANLSNAVLSESDLSGADLQAANLVSSKFESSKFRHTNLYGAHLHNATLNFAVLESARLERADVSGASLVLVKATGSSFAYANLQGAIFRSAILRSVNFAHSDLRRADFTGADLSDANMSSSDLRGADLRFAIGLNALKSLTGARTEGALLPPGIKLK